MERFTRRALINKGGLVAGVVGVASLGGMGPFANALAAGGLSVPRRRTYGAVVEALASVPGSGVRGGSRSAATAGFARWYDTAPAYDRERADAVLDAVEVGLPSGFANASTNARVRLLRRWLHAGCRQHTNGEQHGVIATSALSYVALPFESAENGFRVAVQL